MLAAHVILSMYGFWLPNDPRGSWSDFVAAWELLRFGKATKADTSDSVAYVRHDRAKRIEAKRALKYPPVLLAGLQARAVARGFARAVRESGYPIHACSILDDHVHLVLSPHARTIEQIVRHLRGRASHQLRSEGIHPLASHALSDGSLPSVWSEGMWKVFCHDAHHVGCAIRYVEQNPAREGKRDQHWSFVTPHPLTFE
jgi:REP element-mobilizing transposase RayT